MEDVLGRKMVSDDVCDALHDGVLLMELAERLRPGKIPLRTRAFLTPHTRREMKSNIKLFTKFCTAALGLPDDKVFAVADLFRARYAMCGRECD